MRDNASVELVCQGGHTTRIGFAAASDHPHGQGSSALAATPSFGRGSVADQRMDVEPVQSLTAAQERQLDDEAGPDDLAAELLARARRSPPPCPPSPARRHG